MKKELLIKYLYYFRIIVFIVHLLLIFNLLYITLRMSYIGIIFLIIEFIYSINTLIEMISKKLRYKKDYMYNIMNVCFFAYLLAFYIKIKKNYITPNLFFNYLRNNYILLIFLILLILLYSKIIVNKRQEKL